MLRASRLSSVRVILAPEFEEQGFSRFQEGGLVVPCVLEEQVVKVYVLQSNIERGQAQLLLLM